MSTRALRAISQRPLLAMKTLIVFLVLATGPTAAQRPVASPAASGREAAARLEVARVNGVALTSDRLARATSQLIPLESFHQRVKPERLAALRQQALQTIVDEELRYQDGVRQGLSVSNAEVAKGLQELKKLYVSASAFADAQRQSRVSNAALQQEVRRALTIRKAYQRAVESKCQVTPSEAARYLADNPDRFVVPEQIHVYAISVGVEPSASPSEWAAAKARAEDLLRQIRDGASFEDLARQHSTDPSRVKGGDMGFIHRGSLTDAFEDATRDLKPGEVSGVVPSLYGYHIVRVSEIRPPQRRTFAEVGADLQKDLTAKRCTEVSEAWISGLRARATIVVAQGP